MSNDRRRQQAIATAGAGASAVIHDDSQGSGLPAKVYWTGPAYSWITVAFLLDQPVTLIHKWAPLTTATDAQLSIINGASGAGEVAAASTFFQRSIRLQPGRNYIYVLSGTPAPTANYIAVEYNDHSGIIQ